MNLDTIKMFFQVERNKIIGIGVASCLVTTAIVAPITYFTGQPKYDGVVKPVAFNTVSATGEHLADYGDLDVIEDEYGWGNEENISYVVTDEDLTKNVVGTDNAIGFQAQNVANQQAFNIDEELNVMSAEFTDDKGTSEYVDPNNENTIEKYKLVAPINVYMRVPAPVSIFFKENLMSEIVNGSGQKTIWEKGWTLDESAGIYSDNSNNLNNKAALKSYYVSVKTANNLADLLISYTFFNWMLFNKDNGAASNDDGISYPESPIEANNPSAKIQEEDFAKNIENMINNVENLILDGDEITKEMYGQGKEIKIAGTGTADPYIRAELTSFNNLLNVQKEGVDKNIPSLEGFDTDLSPTLFNEGSSTAWYMPDEEISFDTNDTNGTTTSGGEWSLGGSGINNSYTPSADAFISTQSRRSYYGSRTSSTGDSSISGMSQWGYGYQSTAATGVNEWNYMEQPHSSDIANGEILDNSFGSSEIYDESYANEEPWRFNEITPGDDADNVIEGDVQIMDTSHALPLGFTATTDPLVFFTAGDTEFYYHGDDHEDSKHPEGHPEGTYKPIGMTPEGTNLIFENPTQEPNVTWEFLLSLGFIDAEQVK